MGVRWKRGFRSSCFHHPSASGWWERGRVIAARVYLPDLFSLTAASLTINLNLPRREEFVHICVLAGGGRNGVVMQCNPSALLKEWWDIWSWKNHYYSPAADMDMTDSTIICSLQVSSLFTGLNRQKADEHYILFCFFSMSCVIFHRSWHVILHVFYLNSRFWGSCVKSICRRAV